MPMNPAAVVEASTSIPRIASTPRLRRRLKMKFGRLLKGTSQMWLNAFCAALITPRPASSEMTMPIASATPLPVSGCTFSWSEMIGNWPSVPSRMRFCSSGSPCST